MKNILIIIIAIVSVFSLIQCETTEKSVILTHYKDSLKITDTNHISMYLNKGKEFNHPTFVIWKEDMKGSYLNTIFITKSYASGIFGHAALSDSTWDNKPGESVQSSALPYWTHKKGLIDNTSLIPTKKHPFVDAYTGETPDNDFRFDTNINSDESLYRILVEVNQAWDWNKFWINNKYPESESYKHSAQPSIVYAVTINRTDKDYYLNPIGHGDPKGETGNLFTNLTTLTSAKEIFKSIRIEIQ